jgi:hypothetical protein
MLTIADIIFHPGEPIILSLLMSDGSYQRHSISRGVLRNLCRHGVYALASMYEADERTAIETAAKHPSNSDQPVPVR